MRNWRKRRASAAQVLIFQPLEHLGRIACEKPLAVPRTGADRDAGILHRDMDSILDREVERVALKDDVLDVGDEHVAELTPALQQIIVIEEVPVIVDVDRRRQRLWRPGMRVGD